MADSLVPRAEIAPPAESEKWAEVLWLPCRLTVDLRLREFTVGDVLRLDGQSVVDGHWNQNADVPIMVNGHLIAWAEFEVVGERLAVRVTRLA